MRDWQATLWSASFGGVFFYVEKIKDQFGKRIVSHEFPLRDDPFNEDLGAKARHYDFNAYLASDTCDFDAATLQATLLAFGPQMLVVNDQGPVLCRFVDGTRDWDRDKLGMAAFSLKFVVEGVATPVISGDYLGQMVFDAVGALAGAAVGLVAQLAV